MRYDLNVPFQQKDLAKSQGARWDAVKRVWFYEGETLPDGLLTWYPDAARKSAVQKRISRTAAEILPAAGSEDDPYKDYMTVTALNQMIAGTFSGITAFRSVLVRGEVTNYSGPKRNHYFSIKDASAEISCILWESTAQTALKFRLENGQQVALTGSLEYFEPRGKSQLVVRAIENIGEGLQKLEKLKLRAKLEAEGLFDPAHKKPLPKHARTIGIVTSANGQAFLDISKVAKERCPSIQLVLYPVNVQGARAVKTTVAGIRALDAYGVDVIIVGRGGGSDEELKAYDDEAIVRAIYDAKTPVISAVGHTGNHSFADDAADYFAVTPTEAGQVASPDMRAVIRQAEGFERELNANLRRILGETSSRLSIDRRNLQQRFRDAVDARRTRTDLLRKSLEVNKPTRKLELHREALARLTERLNAGMDRVFTEKAALLERETKALDLRFRQQFEARQNRFRLLLQELNGLSPTAKLVNGYGYISKDGKPLVSVQDVEKGDTLQLKIHDGEIRATAEEILPEGTKS